MFRKMTDIKFICFNCNTMGYYKDNIMEVSHNKLLDFLTCPNCDNKLIPVDKELSETIFILNKLGYKTITSCAGDIYIKNENRFYNKPCIEFEYDKDKFEIIKNIVNYIDTKQLLCIEINYNKTKFTLLITSDINADENKNYFIDRMDCLITMLMD